MFDFRYHALSLVAVFLALAVGLLLGVAIGDAGLVSSAQKKVEHQLRGDLRQANSHSNDLQGEIAAHQRYEEQAYPALVAGRLDGARVGLVALGTLPDSIVNDVDNTLGGTGATLQSVAVIREPPDANAIARGAAGTRYAALPNDDALYAALGQRLAQQYVQGGRLLGRLRRALFTSYSGKFDGHDAVVVYRQPRSLSDDDLRHANDLEKGFLDGLNRLNVPVVGVETTSTSPSQIGWYRDRNLASVDSIDDIAGRTALVFALAGSDGHFGVKPTADALLPKAVGPAGAPAAATP